MLSLTNCAHNIPDVPVFTEINPDMAYFIYTVSDKEGYINNTDTLYYDPDFVKEPKKWNEIKKGSLYVPSFSWEKINAFISQKCRVAPDQCKANGDIEQKARRLRAVRIIYINKP